MKKKSTSFFFGDNSFLGVFLTSALIGSSFGTVVGDVFGALTATSLGVFVLNIDFALLFLDVVVAVGSILAIFTGSDEIGSGWILHSRTASLIGKFILEILNI